MLYALCVAAPTAALALSDKSVPVHCLTDDHHMIGTDNVHNDGSSHQHSSTGDDDHGQPGKCCGLYGLSAIVPDIDFIVGQRPPVSHLASLIANNLSGRGSDRIDRPPRPLLSL